MSMLSGGVRKSGVWTTAMFGIILSTALLIGFNTGYQADSMADARFNESEVANSSDIDWTEPREPTMIKEWANEHVPGIQRKPADAKPPAPIRAFTEGMLHASLVVASAVSEWTYSNRSWFPMWLAKIVGMAPAIGSMGLIAWRFQAVFGEVLP